MLFVPTGVEFRINKRNTKYLGVLVAGRIEFSFDALFGFQDVLAINKIRRALSLALSKKGNSLLSCPFLLLSILFPFLFFSLCYFPFPLFSCSFLFFLFSFPIPFILCSLPRQ